MSALFRSIASWRTATVGLVSVLMGVATRASDRLSEATPLGSEARPSIAQKVPLGTNDVERWLGWLRERRPADYNRLIELRSRRLADFEAEVRRRMEDGIRSASEREASISAPSAGHQLEQYADRIERLAHAYHAAPEDRRSDIRQELKQLVTIAFDLREAERRERVGRLDREVQKLKRELAQRHATQNQIIERKVQEILEVDAATP